VPKVEVYAYDPKTGKDTLVEWTGSAASKDAIAHQAFVNATKVAAYYHDRFGRDSFDGRGTVVKVRVHAPDVDGSLPMSNARWYNDEGRLWIGDGDGTTWKPFSGALDVMAHEFTHGVVDAEVKMDYTVSQEGALHESFADVLGSYGIDGNWQIAEDIFTPNVAGDALRDLLRPEYRSYATLPAWVTEPHDLSGIPSLAATKVVGSIGRDAMLKIWYEGLTNHMRNHAGFGGAAKATIEGAQKLYGRDSREAQAVRDAWAAVGVDDRTPKERPVAADGTATLQSLWSRRIRT
jgi:Zn-dependent metalloprotease